MLGQHRIALAEGVVALRAGMVARAADFPWSSS
jgi:hypothetical protein